MWRVRICRIGYAAFLRASNLILARTKMKHGLGTKVSSNETNEAASKIIPTGRFSLEVN